MRRYKSAENGCCDLAEVYPQILVITAIRDGNAGGHVNEELVDNQSLCAKCDELIGRQTTEVAQFLRFCHIGRDVFGAKYCGERQIFVWQF